jgi:hypothetical protein
MNDESFCIWEDGNVNEVEIVGLSLKIKEYGKATEGSCWRCFIRKVFKANGDYCLPII